MKTVGAKTPKNFAQKFHHVWYNCTKPIVLLHPGYMRSTTTCLTF